MRDFLKKSKFSVTITDFLFSWYGLLFEYLRGRQKYVQEILKLGLTFPSCCSVRENASMNAWAITDKQPSMCGVFLMSKTN